jgi:hypothetical protein
MANHRFGKHPPKRDYRTLRFKDYATTSLSPPPASASSLPRVYEALGASDPGTVFPLDGNDVLGDCTIAALAHAITVNRAFVGKKRIMGRQSVVKLYSHLTGGPDTGLPELDVLNYWRQHPVSGDEILGYVSINPRDHDHVKQAISLFGSVYLGFQVQQNCIQDFDAKKPWTPGPLTNDGHAVLAVGYDSGKVNVLTWGSAQQGTWAWWDECVDEAYAILPPEANNPKFAPGINLEQLNSDLEAVAN